MLDADSVLFTINEEHALSDDEANVSEMYSRIKPALIQSIDVHQSIFKLRDFGISSLSPPGSITTPQIRRRNSLPL